MGAILQVWVALLPRAAPPRQGRKYCSRFARKVVFTTV